MVTQTAQPPQDVGWRGQARAWMLQYNEFRDGGGSETKTMRIEQPHTLGRQEAMSRIDQFFERLVLEPPRGVTIKDARKDWDGNRMNFSFTAAKGSFGTPVCGLMEVLDDRVVVEPELPVFVKAILGEAWIHRLISTGLGDMLAK
jgi:hypothetical protein